jgi:hypothetical protein
MWKQLVLMVNIVHGCTVTQDQVWNCILGEHCLDSVSLHRHTGQSYSLRRPYILAVEGKHYHRLFDDCDSNKDGCIDINDIAHATSCQRPCIWLETMHALACTGT